MDLGGIWHIAKITSGGALKIGGLLPGRMAFGFVSVAGVPRGGGIEGCRIPGDSSESARSCVAQASHHIQASLRFI